jgi:hypothetical protein
MIPAYLARVQKKQRDTIFGENLDPSLVQNFLFRLCFPFFISSCTRHFVAYTTSRSRTHVMAEMANPEQPHEVQPLVRDVAPRNQESLSREELELGKPKIDLVITPVILVPGPRYPC